MGGSLRPEDTPGGGLTMTLTLPIADARAVAGDDQDASPAILQRLDTYHATRHPPDEPEGSG